VSRPLDVICVGGGPAGLYLAVLAKYTNSRHRIRVYERNQRDVTFGFGVVFSENTVGFLSEQDRLAYPEIIRACRRWDPFTVVHGGAVVRCRGVGFAAIERRRLLGILREKAEQAGVEIMFEHEVGDLSELGDADLVVLCDGVNSIHRDPDVFGTSVAVGSTRFTWLATTRVFDSLTFFFERSEHGVFGVHAYPYKDGRSTFIVETDEATWLRAGMDGFGEEETIHFCEELFARHLGGHGLLSNASTWAPFRTVRNRRWHAGNRVLLGDAAHTAHFSVGSGTKMAMEDALALAQQLDLVDGEVAPALAAFEAERRPRVERVQRMAATSFDWWEYFRLYVGWQPYRFTFHFLTRSQFRYETLKERDAEFVGRVEAEQPELDLRPLVLLGTLAVSSFDLDTSNGPSIERWAAGLGEARRAYPGSEMGIQLSAAAEPATAAGFAAAAEAVRDAGFDWLELRFGPGTGFPADVLAAVRKRWPGELPLAVAVPAPAEGDLETVGRALQAAGAGAVTVLAEGPTSLDEAMLAAGKLRAAVGIATWLAIGGAGTDFSDYLKTALLSGRADRVRVTAATASATALARTSDRRGGSGPGWCL
jgi:2-polyprenyl-6-methoxyphenol hydroxylase-like FAD-dependent oxidoreductase